MARKAIKALKDTTKVLGGLGAAYVLSDMLGPKVTGVDPKVEAAALEARKKEGEKYLANKPPAPAPASAAAATVDAPLESRVKIPINLLGHSIEEIRNDETMAKGRTYGQLPINAYKRLQKHSEEGRYASPEKERGAEDFVPAGDLGQFLKKGGVVKASRRADGIAQRGKTRGKMV